MDAAVLRNCSRPCGATAINNPPLVRGSHRITDRNARLCKRCGQRGHSVPRRTIESLLKPEARSRLKDGMYFFDKSPACDIVYFSNEHNAYFTKEDIHVRVGIKESQESIPLCYCFGYTTESVRAEIECTGTSTAAAYITGQIRAGLCACEERNPSGRCCLGEVNKAVNRILKESESRVLPPTLEREHHPASDPDAPCGAFH